MTKRKTKDTSYSISVVAGGIVLLVVFLVIVSSARTSRQRVASQTQKNLVGTWQKVDNEDLIVEFTAGGNVLVNDGKRDLSTSYSINGNRLSFLLEELHGRYVPIKGSVSWIVELQSEEKMLLITDDARDKLFEGKWRLIRRPGVAGGAAALLQLRSKLAACQKSDGHLASLLPELQKSKKQLVDRLRELDIRLASNLKNKPEARTLAEELAELAQQIRVATAKRTEYKKSSDTIESFSRRLTRRDELKNAGLTDEELEEVSQFMAELDDRFNEASSDVEKALNLEAVLKNEL